MNTLSDELNKYFVWGKGTPVFGMAESEWRHDAFGNLLRFSDHGNRASPHGWEIDHITPKAVGGTDELANLRPLHARVNAGLGGLLGYAIGLGSSKQNKIPDGGLFGLGQAIRDKQEGAR